MNNAYKIEVYRINKFDELFIYSLAKARDFAEMMFLHFPDCYKIKVYDNRVNELLFELI